MSIPPINVSSLFSWRRQWHTTAVLLPGESHGQRSLVGCSPWGHEESDMTERLHLHFSLSCIGEGNGNPLQCSCLENPRDRGAWWAAVYGVAQSRTRMKWLSSSSLFPHQEATVAAMVCLLAAIHSECHSRSFWYRLVRSPSSNPLMSLSPTPGSVFSPQAGQLQGLLACRVRPNHWRASQEAKETPMSTEMSRNTDGNGKLQG